MERAVLALLCLSAAFCIASAQDLPRCPDDWLTFYAKYQRANYAQQSQPLLVDQQCTFEVRLSFGPFIVTPTISVCQAGTVSRFIAPSPQGGVYICETVINVPEPAPFAAPLVVNDVPPAPSEATRPADGGISQCPTDAVFNRNRFIFSSLPLIEEVECFIRTRVNGSAGQQKSSVWECKAGYKREFVRRNQFRCVEQ